MKFLENDEHKQLINNLAIREGSPELKNKKEKGR